MRKFYETTYTIKVLSESPIDGNMDVHTVLNETIDGDLVLKSVDSKAKTLTPKQVVKALLDAGSEPAFFSLDTKGNEFRQ